MEEWESIQYWPLEAGSFSKICGSSFISDRTCFLLSLLKPIYVRVGSWIKINDWFQKNDSLHIQPKSLISVWLIGSLLFKEKTRMHKLNFWGSKKAKYMTLQIHLGKFSECCDQMFSNISPLNIRETKNKFSRVA